MNPGPGLSTLLVILMGYLTGSVPFGLIFSRWMAKVDPRHAGSQNIGFTNVLRTAGRGPAVLTLLGDMGKGYLAVMFARELSLEEAGIWMVALSAVLGHNYSIFLGWRGGKGVATGLGVLYGIQPMLGWGTAAIWGVTVLAFRYSSLGAIVAFGFLPLLVLFLRPFPSAIVFSLTLTGLIFVRHTSNIERLRSGSEPKIGRS
jgi:acyl phosphate:glycerol-3-phosphate acyltransferase